MQTLLRHLVLACLIPGLVGAALLVFHDYGARRAALERNSLHTTRALSQAVDSHLFKALAVAQSLSTSDAVRRGDFSSLYRQSRELLAMNPIASSMSLSDTTGQQIFNTSRDFGQPLPKHGSLEQIRHVVETGRPSISNVFRGNVSNMLLVTVDVPVQVKGKVAYVFTVVIRPEIFDDLLKTQGLPPDWIAAVLDGEGVFVTRTHAAERFIGKKPSAELSRHVKQSREGAFESVTPDGVAVLSIFSRSHATGWTVALGVPRRSMEAEYHRPLLILVAGMVLLFSLGLGLAWSLGERIANSVRALTGPARALGMGQPVQAPEVHIREAREVAAALVDASHLLRTRTEALDNERMTRQQQLEKLVAERTEALQEAIRASERLARTDALTGLQNRLSVNERLRSEFLRMKRTGRSYAALLLDIDHFKRINDTHGHEAGDAVLRHIGEVLSTGVRATDFVARFGGEEFLVLLPETDIEGAANIAEKVRAAVAAHDFPMVERVTVSIGASSACPDDGNEDEAVRRADAGLYQAKEAGRDRVRIA